MSATAAEALVDAVWRRHRDEARARVDLLEDAVAGLLTGELREAARAEACAAAHKLAGSLGTFGRPAGSALAREAEERLERPTFADAPRLAELTAGLRSAVEGDSEGPVAVAPRSASGDLGADAVAAPDVLLVEDDEALAELLLHALGTHGRSARWIADGREAADALLGDEPLTPRVILLDVDLPGVDGLGLLRALRERERRDGSRVVMLTARGSEDEVVRAFELGAFDHVAKPFSLPVLLQRVRRALED